MGDGLDAAEVVFKRNVFIGGVGIFVGQAEADQNAGHFESIVHLGHKRDGAAFANENGLFAKAFFQRGLRLLENRSVVRGNPRFSGAEYIKLTVDRFGKQLSNVLLDKFGDLVGILVGDKAR